MKIIFYIFFFTIINLLASCNSEKGEKFDPNRNYSGEELAEIYCGSCHQYPDPSLLSKSLWEDQVLPIMGKKLGVIDFNSSLSEIDSYIKNSTVSISDSNWQKIRNFYVENAIIPEKTDKYEHQITPLFKAVDPAFNVLPLVTALQYVKAEKSLYVGSNTTLYILNLFQNSNDSMLFPSPITNMKMEPGRKEVLNVGNIHPNDNKQGMLHLLDKQDLTLKIDSLRRPVHFASLDLSNNGVDEKIICEFGNNEGELSVFQEVDGKLNKTILSYTPGARKVIGYDFDKNGYTDLLVQFCQGDERVSIFYNDNMKFTEKVVARFPPVYGSSTFDTLDWNNDGNLDFYAVFGDNADYSIMLKEYHGLRIFENDGTNKFNETNFFPMYGATDAKAFDFDQDGDLDFAIIAHFADYKNAPQNAVIYLENRNGKLIPYTVQDLPEGKWLAVETGDYDNDGDEDIILGSFLLPTMHPKDVFDSSTPVVYLQNQLIRK